MSCTPMRMVNSPDSVKHIEDTISSVAVCRPGRASFSSAQLCQLREGQNYIEKIKAQRQFIEQLKDDHERNCQEHSAMLARKEALEGEINYLNGLKLQQAEMAAAKAKLQFDKARLATERGDLQTKIQKVLKDGYKEKAEQLAEELVLLQTQKAEEESSCKHLQAELKLVAQDKEAIAQHFSEAFNDYESRRKSQHQRYNNLKEDYKASVAESEALQKEVEVLALKIKAAQADIEAVKEEEEKRYEENEMAKELVLAQLQNAECCLGQLAREKSSREAEVEELAAANDKLTFLTAEMRKKDKRQEEQMRKLQAEITVKGREVNAQQLEIKRTQIEAKALAEESRKNKQQIAALREQIAAARESVGCLGRQEEGETRVQDEVASLRKELNRVKLLELERMSELVKDFSRKK